MRRRDLVLATRQVFAGLPKAHFVTVAANQELLARVLTVLPQGGRLRAAAGRVDEADQLLLEGLETVPAAVDHVVIASLDHAFIAACRAHQHAGRTVEVIARPGSVSSRLAHAADVVTFLSETTLAIAA